MENDLKKCPYCGEEIKKDAIKCKHCGEFLDGSTQLRKIRKPICIGCLSIIGLFLLLGVIGLLIPDDYNSESKKSSSSYRVRPNGVYGSYSGFGGNETYGSHIYHCSEIGTGKSIVEQLESILRNPPQNEAYLVKISRNNPRLSFTVKQPRWAEMVHYPRICHATVEFNEINPNTIMLYGDGTEKEEYMAKNTYCYTSYTVSQHGDKFKANFIAPLVCTPNAGYR